MNHVKSQLELSRNVHDLQSIDKLRQSAQQDKNGALKEAAQQFEAIFIQMMLKSMRTAQDALADENSPFNTQQVKFYRDMHDQQMATNLASTGSLGLAEIIERQLNPEALGLTPASVLRNDADISSINRNRIQATQDAANAVVAGISEQQATQAFKQSAFDSRESFVAELMPRAAAVADELGLDPKALIAQAALETGWGTQMIHRADGQNSHNLFGIKADSRWQGNKASVDTLEYEAGVASKQKAHFRTYDSFEHSLQDYLSFIQGNPRYQQALDNVQQPEQYFESLQQAGYATDPGYADKLKSIYSGIHQKLNQQGVE